MGKKIVLCVLLICVLAGAVMQNIYITNASAKMIDQLDNIKNALERDDSTAAIFAADEFSASWDKEKATFNALFEHDEVDIVSATVKSIQSFCHSFDKVHALSEIAIETYYFDHILKMDSVRWETIF